MTLFTLFLIILKKMEKMDILQWAPFCQRKTVMYFVINYHLLVIHGNIK